MIISYIIPPNYDFLCETLLEGLSELGHTIYTSEKAKYGIYLKRSNFIKLAINSELLIISSGSYCDYSLLNKITHKKVIYVDGSDYPWLDKKLRYPINIVFKREYIHEKENNIFPLPFAAENRYFNDFNLTRDKLTFITTTNNYFRRSVKYYLSKIYSNNDKFFIGNTGERSYDGISGIPIATPIYYKLLNESIASINIPGKGWDCARFWEIIANKACLITHRLEILIPNNFVEDEHYLGFSTLEELNQKIKFCLDNPEKAFQIANNAYNHLNIFHTTKKRAQYLLEIIDKNYKENKLYNYSTEIEIKSRFIYFTKYQLYKIWKKYIENIFTQLLKFNLNE
jgi:hypothetical protein